MEQVVHVARTLRVDHQFRGYIHLKTIPEASPELIAEAGKWADRISINVELPTQNDLAALAPEKNLARIETSMTTIKTRIEETKAERQNPKGPVFAPAGQSTQMIVGALRRTTQRFYSARRRSIKGSVCDAFIIPPSAPYRMLR